MFMFMTKVIRSLSYTKYHHKALLVSSKNWRITDYINFHSTSKLCVKMFMESENKYAYNIMEGKGYTVSLDKGKKSTNITNTEFNEFLHEDLSRKTANELFDYFPKLGIYCSENNLCISDKIFDTYIDHLTDKISSASEEQLANLFYALCRWPDTESIRTRNYIEVWVALDDECVARRHKWSADQELKFISLFYMLSLTRVSDFSFKCLQKLASKAKQLTPSQIIQTMFFIGIMRKAPSDIHNLEIELKKNFEIFTVDELAIMSMGFFKSKTPIRSLDLVSKIIDKVMKESKVIHDISLTALLKIIRYSARLVTQDKIYELLDVLQHDVPRYSLMCNVHIAMLNSTTLTFHEGCLERIADVVTKNMSMLRLKDLERLVLVYGVFSFKPKTKENFFQKVIDELRNPAREAEIIRHGKSLACCISFLSLSGVYPTDLMVKVLDTHFLSSTYGKHCAAYGKEILTIYNSLKIFYPDIKTNLSDKWAIIMAKRYTDYVPNKQYSTQFNVTETMFLSVLNILKELRGGDEYVVGDHILPHHQRGDIIICNDHNGKPVPISKIMDQKFGLVKNVPDNNKWIVLVIAGKNVTLSNSNDPSGIFLTKVRELEALGYYAGLVKWSIYETLETNEEKLSYINNIIKEAINKNK